MFKKSYAILKNNMVFIQPILLWQIVFTAVVVFSLNRVQAFAPRITMWASMLLLLIACLSGWFYINKYAVLNYDEKDTKEQITSKTVQNFKKFFEGVGSDFFRTLFAFLVIIGLYYAAFYLMYKFCINNFGIPSFFSDFVKIAKNGTQEQIMNIINNLSTNDKITFSKWVFTINTGLSIINFFAILYYAVMSFERKNFIISLLKAIKFFILNIFEAIGIMIFVFVLYLLLNVISTILGGNSFLFALMIILLTLYLNYYVLLVFCFYYDKSKNNSNNRTECIREDELSDKTGKEI